LLEDYIGPRHYGRQRANRRSDYRLEHRNALPRRQREERHVHVKYAVLARRAHKLDLVHVALVGHGHRRALEAP
jgi:hypothetical protein